MGVGFLVPTAGENIANFKKANCIVAIYFDEFSLELNIYMSCNDILISLQDIFDYYGVNLKGNYQLKLVDFLEKGVPVRNLMYMLSYH